MRYQVLNYSFSYFSSPTPARFIGELFKGAIEAVPKGQIEAGLAMGMTRFTLYRRMILPQAIRIAKYVGRRLSTASR